MILLTPQATQDSTNEEIARGVLRLGELQKMEKEFRMKLAKAEADFNDVLAKNRKRWEEEEQAHMDRLKEMAQEVKDAEVEKLKMLVPFDILKEGVDDRFRDAEEFLTGLRKREERAEELTELLEDKLDSLGEREESLKEKETNILLKEKGLNSQIESFKLQSEHLTKQVTEFYTKQAEAEALLKQREESITFREKSQRSAEEGLIQKEQELKDREERVKDERGVLIRAWDEFKRMNSTL